MRMLSGSVWLLLLYYVHNAISLEDTNATVKQETRCGTIATELSADNLQLLIIGGRSGQRGEVPWHAGVYTKTTRPYQQICGGSLISNDVILSAAHCFWNLRKDQQEPADNYAVAAGKLFRPWNDIMEKGQHSDVREIHLPIYFRGSVANYQDDIAVVIVTSRFIYDTFVRPICVDFDVEMERQQLRAGRNGTVAGWGLTEENGKSSQVLKVIEMPYVNTETCIAKSPPSYISYITSDKICAGYMNAGLALCKGDSGGGLAFPRSENGSTQYYLRGLVSSAPTSDNVCNANFYTSFTRLQKHEQFIKQFWEPRLNCVLPPYPKHGSYEVNKPNAKPGDSFDAFIVNVTCSPGWGMVNRGNGSIFMCYNGWWAEKMPNRCDLLCVLRPHYSVIYSCVDPSVPGGSRECNSKELPGTEVKVRCRTPEFDSLDLLPKMQCINGKWSSNPRCRSAQCGTVSVESEEHQLPTAGWSAKRGEVPWHAGIYSKTVTPYRQICGGSLISRTAVISAAQCFWTIEEGIMAVTQYAVAVGKLYRPWDDEKDEAQRSDVQEIVPGEYFQAWTTDQHDIALVKVIMAFNFTAFVQPVCVDFTKYLIMDQLQPESFGKIAGWGITDEYGNMSQALKVTELPYVNLETALTAAKLSYNSFITDDKFYAGYADGRSSMCTEDSGGGLAFLHLEDGVVRYYLRGVLSSGPSSEPVCSLYTYAAFTNIQKHERFLENYFESEYLDDSNYSVEY